MRLFIAMTLPPAFLPLLEEAGAVFAAQARKISRTKPENLHLTLRFLGEVEEGKIPALCRLVRGLPPGSRAALSYYGSFQAREGLTLWAGLSCDPDLLAVARAVEEGVLALSFPAERRPFVPHITLARRAKLKATWEDIQPRLPLHPAPLGMGPVVLYQSQLHKEGPVYTPLSTNKDQKQQKNQQPT